MNINTFIRQLLIKLFSPSLPKPPRKPSAFNLMIRKTIGSTKFIIITTFSTLLLLLFLFFSTIWIYLINQVFGKGYLSLPFISVSNESEITLGIVSIGAIVEILGIFIIYEKNERKIKKILNQIRQRIESVIRDIGLHNLYSKWVYGVSKSYFNKIFLPNIDLIETGLINQNASGLLNIILYKDEVFKSPRQLRQIGDRYFGLFLLTATICFIVSLMVASLISRGFHLIFDPSIKIIADMMSGLAVTACLLSLKISYDMFFYPNSIIGMRLEALANEISRLEHEEIVHNKIQDIESDAGSVAKQYDELLATKRQDFYETLKELASKQEELQVTEESIEVAMELARNDPSAFRLILKEQDKLSEERGKKTYWKEKAIDIFVITIVLGLFVNWLSNVLFR